MKYTSLFLILLLVSCSHWSNEDQKAFTRRCMEAEKVRGTSELIARAYCECALKKTAQRYKTFTEATANKDSTALATQLEICRRSTQ